MWSWLKRIFKRKTKREELPLPIIEMPKILKEKRDCPPVVNGHNFLITHFESEQDLENKILLADYKIVWLNLELDQIEKCRKSFIERIKEEHGVYLIAYVSASYEDWRSDAKYYPSVAMGKKMKGWDELWGDITNTKLQMFLKERFKRAKLMGCDAVEVDNVDIAFNKTGHSVSIFDNITAIKTLASIAGKLNLGYFVKNTPKLHYELSRKDEITGVFIESAFKYDEVAEYASYIRSGKPAFYIEYSSDIKPIPGAIVQSHYKDYFMPPRKTLWA